jgi:hypothetical protein
MRKSGPPLANRDFSLEVLEADREDHLRLPWGIPFGRCH